MDAWQKVLDGEYTLKFQFSEFGPEAATDSVTEPAAKFYKAVLSDHK